MPHLSRSPFRLVVLLSFLLFSLFPSSSQSQATAPSLVRDITTPGLYKDEAGESRPVAVAGDLVFFLGTDPAHGGELWRSDGTAEGTFLLRDIVPGPGAGVSEGWWENGDGFVFADSFYFKAQKYERLAWWKTDGTTAGTIPFLPSFRGVLRFFPVDDTLYLFRNCPGAGACELWKSDGTLAGTVKVKSLPTMATGDAPAAAKAGGLLFFSFPGATRELWRSDGTEAGTYRIGSFDGLRLSDAGEMGGALWFSAEAAGAGFELWKSDGTEAGTVQVKDVWQGAGSSNPRSMRSLGGTLFFSAEDAASGRELWKSDGTEAATVQVKDVWPGLPSSGVYEIANLGGTLFFSGEDSAGPGLWKSDGTEAGTVRVGGSVFISYPPGPLLPAGNLLFFVAFDEEHGMEVWRSDGTDAGTFVVRDNWPGPYDSMPQNLITNGGTLYFYGNYPDSSGELWKSDGTEEGTVVVRDLVRPESSVPSVLTVSGGHLFFNVRERPYERSLWKSDGTAAGTVLAHSIFPQEMKDFQGSLHFSANGSYYPGVWRTDGTPGGLSQVFGGTFYSLSGLTEAGGRLFFRAYSPTLGEDLYETSAGLVKDLWPGSAGSLAGELTEVNGTLFFRADGNGSSGLWRSDGTAPGTFEIAGVPSRQLTRAGNLLYFTVFDESTWSHALWRSDGSSGGTYAIGSWNPGDEPSELTEVNGQLFLALSLGTGGQELRRSDGGGTYLLQSFDSRSPLIELTRVGTRLFFTAEDANGRELWRSDGTPGALRVKDIHPGPAGSLPQSLTEASGWLVFTAIDPAHGRELWMSDGTEGGTFLVADIAPGPLSSRPEEMTPWNRKVYFSADDGSTGIELWSFEIEEEEPEPTNTPPFIEDIVVSPDYPVPVGSTIRVSVAFVDPDPGQSHIVVWSWGDDSEDTFEELPPERYGAGSSHVYAAAGIYTITVRVIDDTGRSSSWAIDPVYVYDPNGPVVKGAGWIPLSNGKEKGHFQIRAEYPPGASEPVGQVRFKAPGVDLSGSVILLIVNGPTAWLLGYGSLGDGTFAQYWIAVTDGQAPGGDGVDRLRIHISFDGQLIFDNEPGTPTNAPPATPLGGGTIQFQP